MKKLRSPLLLLLALLVSFNVFSIPKLSSYPSAKATIFLDFDGEYINNPVWNGGNAITCLAAPMNDLQITEVFNRVSEDYRPFDLNITTDESVFLAAPITQRIRVVITPTSGWFTGVGGVSYVGSFTWGDDTPCFVFCDRLGPNSAKMVGECCSHESGHTVGLTHQSRYDAGCNLTAVYHDGVGTGESAWAPIMGNSYYRNMSAWNNGPTPYGCTNTQDNLSIITSTNGFGYRVDDHSNDISTTPTDIDIDNFNFGGVITTTTDKDAYQFDLVENSNFWLNVDPFSIGANDNGANLDVKMSLYKSDKSLVRSYDPATTMNLKVDTILSKGRYYMLLEGAANANTSDYGSLGSYRVTGLSRVLPIRDVTLSGRLENNKHTLNWNIISNEPIVSAVVEGSPDGKNFTAINSVSPEAINFIYTPFDKGDMYYRLKVSSSTIQNIYSNMVRVKGIEKTITSFGVSTIVQSEIQVNAPAKFEYVLTDINGRLITRGEGTEGINKVNVYNQSKGLYILQLICNNKRQTERILKQ